MKILVVNDDGIHAEGIRRLAEMAVQLGEVWVAAPDSQRSAMSHSITPHGDIIVKQTEFPVDGVRAFSISGTPADCIKIGIRYLMKEKPDIVFSGINNGYNAGLDILYSGTVGAAMEAVLNGIPAIAFSSQDNGVWDVVEEYLLPITKELMEQKIGANEIWNVNFPGCSLSEFNGIQRDRIPGSIPFYLDHYDKRDLDNGDFVLTSYGLLVKESQEGTDMRALSERCISIGTLKNAIL